MTNIILSELESPAVYPANIVLSEIAPQYDASELKSKIYWRFADEKGEAFKFLGEASPGMSLDIPIDLQGKDIILSSVSYKGNTFSVDDPRKGEQVFFTPK